ncbi:MAG: purine-binding chemotaxis protein CheW, partial [Colwellia sp.]
MTQLSTNNMALVKENIESKVEQYAQYLTFSLGKEQLAINISEVKEIIEINHITRVPMTPDYIRGVIHLRGNVVPVVDLSARLSNTVCTITKLTCIILVEIDTGSTIQQIGIIVDKVEEIIEISNNDTKPPPGFGGDINVDFIQAMGKIGDNFIILLEVSKILSTKELSQLTNLSNP